MSKPVTSLKPALKNIKQTIDKFAKTEQLPLDLLWRTRSDIEYVTAIIGIRNDFVPSRRASKGRKVRIAKKPTSDELTILLTQIQDDIEKANTYLEKKKYEETYAQALNVIYVLDRLLKVKQSTKKRDNNSDAPLSQ